MWGVSATRSLQCSPAETQSSQAGLESEATLSSIGGAHVTLLMKQKILESNCWWIITCRENSQLHWLGEQGVSFWTSRVNELWPEIYNLVVSVMDLTPAHNSGRPARSFGLYEGQRPSGVRLRVLPFLCGLVKVAFESCSCTWSVWLRDICHFTPLQLLAHSTDNEKDELKLQTDLFQVPWKSLEY